MIWDTRSTAPAYAYPTKDECDTSGEPLIDAHRRHDGRGEEVVP